MFFWMLVLSVVLAAFHAYRSQDRTRVRVGELLLVYVLVLYCGVPMVAVSLGVLVAPERMATMLPIGPPSPLVSFFGWAYLGMSVIAVMTLRYRGGFLAAAAIVWAVYFAGANLVHLQGGATHGTPTSHAAALMVFATHGIVPVLLLAGMVLGKPLRQSRP